MFDQTQLSPADKYRYLKCQGKKMEAINSSETMVTTYNKMGITAQKTTIHMHILVFKVTCNSKLKFKNLTIITN
jgi:hypothetical protein